MQAFQCLGGECEDTCCQHWDIRFDKLHYEKLREAVGQCEFYGPDIEQWAANKNIFIA